MRLFERAVIATALLTTLVLNPLQMSPAFAQQSRTLDWQALQQNNPELYELYKTELEEIEAQVALLRAENLLLQLVTMQVSGAHSSLGQFIEDQRILWDYVIEEDGGWFPNSVRVLSLGTLLEVGVVFGDLAESAANSTDSFKHTMWVDFIGGDRLGRTSSLMISAPITIGVVLLALSNNRGPVIPKLNSATVGRAMISSGAIMSFTNSSIGAELKESRLQHQQEVAQFENFVKRENQLELIRHFYPGVKDIEANQIMDAMISAKTPRERLRKLFGFNFSYSRLLNSFDQVDEAVQKVVQKIRSGEVVVPSNVRDRVGLRRAKDALPTDIGAYLAHLQAQLDQRLQLQKFDTSAESLSSLTKVLDAREVYFKSQREQLGVQIHNFLSNI